MHQLDPFVIYTIKLTMDFKSKVKPGTDQEKTLFDEKHVVDCSEQGNNTMSLNTIKRILQMKSLSHHDNRISEKVPKLRKENILSLLYHADEQWMSSINELNTKDISELDYVISHIHRQQRIYLDTLHLFHKTMNVDEPKRFNEPVWFAAQVLFHQCQVRHLEAFTHQLLPLATNLYNSMQQLRICIYQTCQKQCRLKQSYYHHKKSKQQKHSFLHNFFFSDSTEISRQNFYASCDHLNLLTSIRPTFDTFIHHWSLFEKALYECYVQHVFGKQYYLDHLESQSSCTTNATNATLPYELFCDPLTQLLPLTLNRAILYRRLLDIHDIQAMDPLAFVALPRLAILAGVTWLSHLTGWRHTDKRLPHWIDTHTATLHRLVHHVALLESQSLDASTSHDAHHQYVTNYHQLEHALVHGMVLGSALEKEMYIAICSIADSILSSPYASSFNRVLCCLFKYCDDPSSDMFEMEEDAVPIEQTLLHLAI